MPHYNIKFRHDMGFFRKYRADVDMEAGSPQEAVLKFMQKYTDVQFDEPVKGSPLSYAWLATGTVGDVINKVAGSRWRVLTFRAREGDRVQILSVKETDTIMCQVCVGERRYANTSDLCFACAGLGRTTPQLAAVLNRHLAAEIERRQLDRLSGREYATALRQIVDDLQSGHQSLSEGGLS